MLPLFGWQAIRRDSADQSASTDRAETGERDRLLRFPKRTRDPRKLLERLLRLKLSTSTAAAAPRRAEFWYILPPRGSPGVSGKALVSQRIALFRKPSLWEQYKWHFVAGTALAIAELVLIVFLVTERQLRKKSDLKIARLSGRLLEISEQERHRIARELHDDIVQRLSMICFEFALIDQDSPRADKSIRSSVHVQLEQLKEIISDIHQLSRQLHSNDLNMFGLSVALGDLCRKLAKQYGVEVELVTDGTQLELNRDIALCFYRVAQEALSNALKHSGSQRIELHLAARQNTLILTVRDYGKGFDPSAVLEGLGQKAPAD